MQQRQRPKPRVLLDSGAFNVWNRRRKGQPVEPIDIGAYIAYVGRLRDCIHAHVVLDEIPPIDATYSEVQEAAKQSSINLQVMKDAGLKPMPVYHQGERIFWLQRMIDGGHDYIGISPVKKGITTKDQRVFLDAAFKLLSNHEHISTHGFGVTKSELLINYPFTTVDSTTWALSRGNHVVYLPPRGDDGRPDYTRKAIKIITSREQEPEVLQWAEEYIEGLDTGLTWFQMVQGCEIPRRQLILHYLTALSESRGIAVFHATNLDASASEILAGRQITDHLLSYFDLRNKPDEALRSYVSEGGKARKPIKFEWKDDFSHFNDPRYYRFRRGAMRRRLASGG